MSGTETAIPTTQDQGCTPARASITAAELAAELGIPVERAESLLPVAAALVERYAPDAPAAVLNEAIIRCAGWIEEHPAAGVRSNREGEVSTGWAAGMTGALLHSGAKGLLYAWRRKTAGAAG